MGGPDVFLTSSLRLAPGYQAPIYLIAHHMPLIIRKPTACMPGAALTRRTTGCAACRGELDDKLLLVEAHGIELQAGPVGKKVARK